MKKKSPWSTQLKIPLKRSGARKALKQSQYLAYSAVNNFSLVLSTHIIPHDLLSQFNLIPKYSRAETPSRGLQVQPPSQSWANAQFKPSSGFCDVESQDPPRPKTAQPLVVHSHAGPSPRSKLLPLTENFTLPFNESLSLCSVLLSQDPTVTSSSAISSQTAKGCCSIPFSPQRPLCQAE